MATIRKTVIPAAGFGTRMLPAAKAVPKEMLPVLGKPTIQYVIEEAAAAGLSDALLITSREKRALEDHFDRSGELEERLRAGGKDNLLASVRDLAAKVRVHAVRQGEQLGLGHAVLQARDHVGREPFLCQLGDAVFSPRPLPPAPDAGGWDVEAFRGRPIGRVLTKMGRVTREQVVEGLEFQKRRGGLLGQMLLDLGYLRPADVETAVLLQQGKDPVNMRAPDAGAAGPLPAAQLVEAYGRLGTTVIGLEEVPPEKVERYGIVGGQMIGNGVIRVDTLVEKPSRESAPSRLAVAARYVLTPEVFDCLDRTAPGKGGEIQLTDALKLLLERGPIHGVVLKARRHDIGNPVDWLKTNLVFARRDPNVWPQIESLVRSLLE